MYMFCRIYQDVELQCEYVPSTDLPAKSDSHVTFCLQSY